MHTKADIKAFVQLLRFELAFAAGICVMVGGFIASQGQLQWPLLASGFLCGFLMAGSANTMNDYFDVEVDAENAPDRPLPSGRVSRRGALVFSLVTALAGLGLSLTISLNVFACSMVVGVLSVLYNWKLKQTGLPGNITVAICVACTFIMGAIIAGDMFNKYVWLLSLLAFLVDLGEEIAGDAMDEEGDRIRHTRSVAIKYGKKVALKISAAIFSLVVIISLLPAVMGKMNGIYTVLLIVVNVAVLIFAWNLMNSKTREKGLLYMRAIYTTAYLGLAVIYALAFSGTT